MRGIDRMPGRSNYIVGNDTSRWKTDIAQYAKVLYEDVYPGIDMVYYGKQHELEFDLIVAPGSDPAQAALKFDGLDRMEIDDDGDLVLETASGTLIQHKPIAYQHIDGKRVLVNAEYKLADDQRITFKIGDYDPANELIIDPVLSYSTYISDVGGNSYAYDMAADPDGNMYIAGFTYSASFPGAMTPGQATDAYPDAVVLRIL